MIARSLRLGLALSAVLLFLALGPAPAGAADTGVYVEVKESEAPDADVVERFRLYGSSHALVIGIDDYGAGWPRLANAVKDARGVASALRRNGFQVTFLENATGDELRMALRKFFVIKGADPDARLFVWYAGHGHTMDGQGYLVPADAGPPGTPEFLQQALPMWDFGSLVKLAKAKHAMAIFDSCFAGTIFNVQRSSPPAAITQATMKPVRQFLTSGDAEQQVSDDGTFRRLFIDALAGTEQADANRDGYLTGSELGLYLETRVTNLTQGLQTPRSGKLRDPGFDHGDFVFVLPRIRTAAAAVAPEDHGEPSQPGPAQGDHELEFWNAIKDSYEPNDYRAYLEAFPQGSFAPLARARVKRLQEVTAPKAVTKRAASGATSSEVQVEAKESRQKTIVSFLPVQFDVIPLNMEMVAIQNANIRSEPSIMSAKTGLLKSGTRIDVTGATSVENDEWYRITRDGKSHGYVHASLLQPPRKTTQQAVVLEMPAKVKEDLKAKRSVSDEQEPIDPKHSMEIMFWDSVKSSGSPDLYRAYLAQYPSGAFRTIVQIRLETLERDAGASTEGHWIGSARMIYNEDLPRCDDEFAFSARIQGNEIRGEMRRGNVRVDLSGGIDDSGKLRQVWGKAIGLAGPAPLEVEITGRLSDGKIIGQWVVDGGRNHKRHGSGNCGGNFTLKRLGN